MALFVAPVGPYRELVSLRSLPPALESRVAAMAWMRKPAELRSPYLWLPSDVFVLCVDVEVDAPGRPAARAGGIEVSLATLRSRPQALSRNPGRETAVALLTPLGMLQAFRTPLGEGTDRRLPLADLCGPDEERTLKEVMADSRSPHSRLMKLATWLERRILEEEPALPAAARRVGLAAMRMADLAQDTEHVNRFSNAARSGESAFERAFRYWLGVSPGAYLRLAHFQRAEVFANGGAALLAENAALRNVLAERTLISRGEPRPGAATLARRRATADGIA